jgi:hypothetical protein
MEPRTAEVGTVVPGISAAAAKIFSGTPGCCGRFFNGTHERRYKMPILVPILWVVGGGVVLLGGGYYLIHIMH